MESKHQVHNLIILDESGSMESIKKNIIAGFNELVQTVQGIQEQFPEQEHFITMFTFNGFGHKILHFIDPVTKLKKINDERYHPAASTPLYDAIGSAVAKLKQVVANQTKCNVLVTILTDGEENASVEYSAAAIKKIIEELKEQNWTFTYIGTDHDVTRVAHSISINNTISFAKNSIGLGLMFRQETSARAEYSKKIRENRDTKDGYYDYETKK